MHTIAFNKWLDNRIKVHNSENNVVNYNFVDIDICI